MADVQEAVRRLSIQTTETGTADATKKLNDLARAQGGVAVASANTEKATLSLDKSFTSIERKYVAQVRAQQDYEKIQRQVNAAVSQNPALQERANVVLAAARERHDQLAGSQRSLNVIAADLNGRLQAQAGSFGVVGQALTALGPAGLATAATLGSLAAAFYLASAGAHDLAAKARELKDFSESTGLTVNQVQALRSEATKFGVDSDTLQAGLQKFTTGFQELRLGTGDLLTQVRRINPALADQMALATDTATAFTLYGQAVAQTTNIFERNALARAGLGKGGPTVAEFLGKVGDVKALADAYDAAGKGLQRNMIDKLSELDLQIAKTTGKARENFSSIFAEPVLQAELTFAKAFLNLSEIAKNFSMSEDLKRYLQIYLRIATAPIPIVGLAVSAGLGLSGSGGGRASTSIDDAHRQASMAEALAISDAVPRTRPSAGGSTETPESLAAKWRNYVSVLGTAATPSERLNAAISELGVKAKEAGVGADVLARGIAGLKLDDAIARQNAHNSALGAAASQADILRAKTLELAKAQQQGAGLTDQQIAKIKEVTASQALGTYQIDAATAAEELRMKTLFRGSEAALSYATSQDIINKKLQAGEPLNEDQIKQIRASADAYAKVKTQADLYSEALNGIASSMSSTLTTGITDILDGTKSIGQGFQDMSKMIVRAIEEAIVKLLIVGPLINSLKGSLGGLGGGFDLSSLFGGAPSINANGSIAGAVGATSVGGAPLVGLHSGGIVGAEATFHRYVHPAHFDNASRFHTGGIAGDEVPIIARKGEGVFTQGQMAALGRGAGGGAAPQVTVNVVNAPAGVKSQTSQTDANGNTRVDVILNKAMDEAVGKSLSTGTGRRVLRGQYGVNQFTGQ